MLDVMRRFINIRFNSRPPCIPWWPITGKTAYEMGIEMGRAEVLVELADELKIEGIQIYKARN